MKPLRWLIILSGTSFLIVLLGQGCFHSQDNSQIRLESLIKLNSSGVTGNGGTYDGKLLAHHYVPGFTCEGKSAPQSTIERDQGQWYYSESNFNQCHSISRLPISHEEIEIQSSFNYAVYKSARYYFVPLDLMAQKLPCSDNEKTTLPYAGGDGTSENPYQICSDVQLDSLSKNSSDWNKHFELRSNLDLRNYSHLNFKPIGNTNHPFTGRFSGNGFAIYNLNYIQPAESNVGLFGRISGAAHIQHLTLINFNIQGSSAVGALIGLSDLYVNSSPGGNHINNCYSIGGKIQGIHRIGGLIGHANGIGLFSVGVEMLVQSLRLTNISSPEKNYSESTGGLAGEIGDSSVILNGFSFSLVSGFKNVGGLVGAISAFKISEDALTFSPVSSVSESRIWNSFSNSDVTGIENVGGFIGFMSRGFVSQTYATGSVFILPSLNSSINSGHSTYVGYLDNFSFITESYASGRLSGAFSQETSGGMSGISIAPSQVLLSYFSDPVKGLSGFQVTEEQLKQSSTFSGWDFTRIWKINEGEGFPQLR